MILICFGTRPEWLKVKPLLKVLDNYQLLFTGQHEDLLKSVEVDYRITMGDHSNRLDGIISDCMIQFPEGGFDSVLVQGDTASAFGCALAAFNRKLKIYYLESGLRTYQLDHPYPEEGYRQMICRLADKHFCPTELAARNVEEEKCGGTIDVVGNTVLDNLVHYRDKCSYGDQVLVTLHRRENHHLMREWFLQLEDIARWNPILELIIPLHPNPNVQKHKDVFRYVKVVDPLEYPDLLNLLVKSKFVITDSGGLQEEGSFFNKKVIVCRECTERPEAIATGHLHMCSKPELLKDIVTSVNRNPIITQPCPYGDGNSATRIKDLLWQKKKIES